MLQHSWRRSSAGKKPLQQFQSSGSVHCHWGHTVEALPHHSSPYGLNVQALRNAAQSRLQSRSSVPMEAMDYYCRAAPKAAHC